MFGIGISFGLEPVPQEMAAKLRFAGASTAEAASINNFNLLTHADAR
jgi:hypothetical protein